MQSFKIDQSQKVTCAFQNLIKGPVNAVFTFQYTITHEFIKKELSQITKISQFSDGAASQPQQKNHKNFTNLLHHTDDFHISAKWHFFATSHGKNTCDGTVSTIKHLAAYSSLQKSTICQNLKAHSKV